MTEWECERAFWGITQACKGNTRALRTDTVVFEDFNVNRLEI